MYVHVSFVCLSVCVVAVKHTTQSLTSKARRNTTQCWGSMVLPWAMRSLGGRPSVGVAVLWRNIGVETAAAVQSR